MAQLIRLHLPSCSRGLKSQAHDLRFIQLIFKLWCEKDVKKQKRPGQADISKLSSRHADAATSMPEMLSEVIFGVSSVLLFFSCGQSHRKSEMETLTFTLESNILI